VWAASVGLRTGTSVDFRGKDEKPSSSMKFRELIHWFSNHWLLPWNCSSQSLLQEGQGYVYRVSDNKFIQGRRLNFRNATSSRPVRGTKHPTNGNLWSSNRRFIFLYIV